MKIIVRRETIFYRGQLRPIRDHYYATGPEGRQFDNSSLKELKRVIERRYATKVELEVK